MRVGLRRSRRDALRLLLLGGTVVLAVGCSVPASLAEKATNLPDLPDLPDLPLDGLASLTSASTPTTPTTADPTVSPEAASTPSVSSPTPVPETLVVAKTDGDGVYIRSSIKPEKKVKNWRDGTQMLVVGADQTVDKRTWKNVKDPAGNVGWVPAQYLAVPLRAVTTPSPRSTASGAATPATAVGAATARWNTAEIDAFASGNVSVAAQQLRALGASEVRGRAQKPESSVVLRDTPKYYGTIVRIEGYVGLVQQVPADSSAAKLLGPGVVHLVLSCRDGTMVNVFQLGAAEGARVGDLVAAYGLPVGQGKVEDRLAGTTTRLVVVAKLIEKVPK